MNPQLFVSGIEPKEEFFHPVKSEMDLKPRGGLWTSTYSGKSGSSWVRFCLNSGARNYDNKVNSWLLIPSKEARIYTIDSYSDLEKLMEKYMYIPEMFSAMGESMKKVAEEQNMVIEHALAFHSSFSTFIDFEKLSQDFDALHLTENGMYETKSPTRIVFENNEIKMVHQKYTLWGYDCECTFWLKWCFESIQHLGKKSYSNN